MPAKKEEQKPNAGQKSIRTFFKKSTVPPDGPKTVMPIRADFGPPSNFSPCATLNSPVQKHGNSEEVPAKLTAPEAQQQPQALQGKAVSSEEPGAKQPAAPSSKSKPTNTSTAKAPKPSSAKKKVIVAELSAQVLC